MLTWTARKINLIQDGGGKKAPPTSFSPVTSSNVGISHQSSLTLFLTLLPHRCKISKPYLVPVSNYWTWTKTTPQKKWFFWSNPCKIEVMITSLIELLELSNFDHMTTSTTKYESPDKILLMTSWAEIMTS